MINRLIAALLSGSLLFGSEVLAQPATTKPSVSNTLTPCLANVPVVGNGAGVGPVCWPTGALTAIAHVTPGSGVNTALANAVNTAGGFTTSPVPNANLANSTISGVALGASLATLTYGTHLTNSAGASTYNGSAASTLATDATAANTASTIMARDGSGQVAAATFTGALAGNATTATSATSATNATNTAVTDDTTTNATVYPTWVTANTGNLPQKLSSTKLSFNPSTGVLSSTSFTGALTGTTTNDNAAAGNVGEYNATAVSAINNTSATITMTIAAPAVVTWTAHGFCYSGATGCGTAAVATALKFTTTGSLPTGIVSGTTYYLRAIDANTFNVATTCANALAGTFITTSGSQSGTQTGDIRINLATGTGAAQDVACITVSAGDHDVGGQMLKGAGASTTVTYYGGSLSLVSNTKDTTFGRRLSFQYGGLALGASEFTVFDFAPTRFSFTSPTNVYLVSDDIFATSTLIGSGWMRERRAR